jgi:hypothetical protein
MIGKKRKREREQITVFRRDNKDKTHEYCFFFFPLEYRS